MVIIILQALSQEDCIASNHLSYKNFSELGVHWWSGIKKTPIVDVYNLPCQALVLLQIQIFQERKVVWILVVLHEPALDVSSFLTVLGYWYEQIREHGKEHSSSQLSFKLLQPPPYPIPPAACERVLRQCSNCGLNLRHQSCLTGFLADFDSSGLTSLLCGAKRQP